MQNGNRRQKARASTLWHTLGTQTQLLPAWLPASRQLYSTDIWLGLYCTQVVPLLPHFTHSLSPFRYVYACARGCVRFSQHTRIQRRPDSFALNHYRAILIDKIMYFAIFLYLSRDIDEEGQSNLSDCMHTCTHTTHCNFKLSFSKTYYRKILTNDPDLATILRGLW